MPLPASTTTSGEQKSNVKALGVTKFQYLNSGLFMGFASDIRAILEDYDYDWWKDEVDDQLFW